MKHCEKRLEKQVISHGFDFDTSKFDFEVSKLSIWKHTTSCDKGAFLSLLSRNFDESIEFKCLRVCYFVHMFRYTKWEDLSLTITYIVSSVYKRNANWNYGLADLKCLKKNGCCRSASFSVEDKFFTLSGGYLKTLF